MNNKIYGVLIVATLLSPTGAQASWWSRRQNNTPDAPPPREERHNTQDLKRKAYQLTRAIPEVRRLEEQRDQASTRHAAAKEVLKRRYEEVDRLQNLLAQARKNCDTARREENRARSVWERFNKAYQRAME